VNLQQIIRSQQTFALRISE